MDVFAEYDDKPTCLDEMKEGVFYSVSRLDRFTLPRGRKLDEALRNDPSAPEWKSFQGMRGHSGGKYYTRAMLEGFVLSYSVDGAYSAHLKSGCDLEASALAAVDRAKRDGDRVRAKARDEAAKVLADATAFAADQKAKAVAAIRQECDRVYADLMEKFAKPVPVDGATGIYFLFKGGVLQYIGQSVNVHSRIQQHRSSKDFDEAKFVACDASRLNDMEGFFIRLLEPPLNGGKMTPDYSLPPSPTWEATFSLAFVDGEGKLSDRALRIAKGFVR